MRGGGFDRPELSCERPLAAIFAQHRDGDVADAGGDRALEQADISAVPTPRRCQPSTTSMVTSAAANSWRRM